MGPRTVIASTAGSGRPLRKTGFPRPVPHRPWQARAATPRVACAALTPPSSGVENHGSLPRLDPTVGRWPPGAPASAPTVVSQPDRAGEPQADRLGAARPVTGRCTERSRSSEIWTAWRPGCARRSSHCRTATHDGKPGWLAFPSAQQRCVAGRRRRRAIELSQAREMLAHLRWRTMFSTLPSRARTSKDLRPLNRAGA